jgi:hypothetical protein
MTGATVRESGAPGNLAPGIGESLRLAGTKWSASLPSKLLPCDRLGVTCQHAQVTAYDRRRNEAVLRSQMAIGHAWRHTSVTILLTSQKKYLFQLRPKWGGFIRFRGLDGNSAADEWNQRNSFSSWTVLQKLKSLVRIKIIVGLTCAEILCSKVHYNDRFLIFCSRYKFCVSRTSAFIWRLLVQQIEVNVCYSVEWPWPQQRTINKCCFGSVICVPRLFK